MFDREMRASVMVQTPKTSVFLNNLSNSNDSIMMLLGCTFLVQMDKKRFSTFKVWDPMPCIGQLYRNKIRVVSHSVHEGKVYVLHTMYSVSTKC